RSAPWALALRRKKIGVGGESAHRNIHNLYLSSRTSPNFATAAADDIGPHDRSSQRCWVVSHVSGRQRVGPSPWRSDKSHGCGGRMGCRRSAPEGRRVVVLAEDVRQNGVRLTRDGGYASLARCA